MNKAVIFKINSYVTEFLSAKIKKYQIALFQFLFAGVFAFVLFHEAPHPAFYGAGLLVVSGAVLVIYSANKFPPRHIEESLVPAILPENAT
ncbi:MAG: hypothetical protein EOO68_05410 [Moraxellaceae bacterium]|nr:MAG: hypothetical protein EOO68_05410 [Moraxellaceae bacterium]